MVLIRSLFKSLEDNRKTNFYMIVVVWVRNAPQTLMDLSIWYPVAALFEEAPGRCGLEETQHRRWTPRLTALTTSGVPSLLDACNGRCDRLACFYGHQACCLLPSVLALMDHSSESIRPSNPFLVCCFCCSNNGKAVNTEVRNREGGCCCKETELYLFIFCLLIYLTSLFLGTWKTLNQKSTWTL